MSRRSYWKQQAKDLADLSPIKTHTCPETGDEFHFLHKTIAHEELANRIVTKYRKKKGSKKDATTNEYLVTLYMVLECDEKGKRERDNPNSPEFLEEIQELIDNPAFAYHLNGALKAIGEAPDDEEGVIDGIKEAKKPSSKTTKPDS